jgi:hypothetical protein
MQLRPIFFALWVLAAQQSILPDEMKVVGKLSRRGLARHFPASDSAGNMLS